MPTVDPRHSLLLRAVLPPQVLVRETHGTLDEAEALRVLWPEERDVVAQSVVGRIREFATVRASARELLDELGVERRAILPDPDRAPRWPPGIVGSMTHCAGFCGVALARSDDIHALGIDAEPDQELPAGVLDLIALPDERAMLQARSGQSIAWDRLLFSAKEAVFKAGFTIDRQWRDFVDVRIQVGSDGGFDAVRVSGPALPQLVGRWIVGEGLIVTAAVGYP